MELWMAGISDMEAANAFLLSVMARYDAGFAKVPRRGDNLHRPMNIEPDRLRDVFCLRDDRYADASLAFALERQGINESKQRSRQASWQIR